MCCQLRLAKCPPIVMPWCASAPVTAGLFGGRARRPGVSVHQLLELGERLGLLFERGTLDPDLDRGDLGQHARIEVVEHPIGDRIPVRERAEPERFLQRGDLRGFAGHHESSWRKAAGPSHSWRCS